MSIDLDVETPIRTRSAEFEFDQFRLYHRDLGQFGLRVYMPTERQIDELERQPSVNNAFGPGWGQGVDAVDDIGHLLARDGHMRVTAVKPPRGNYDLHQLVPLYTGMLRSATDVLQEHYGDAPTVITGYSRGSYPAAVVAGEHAGEIAGAGFIMPTWFRNKHTPAGLALRGVAEGIGSVVNIRSSLSDRRALVKMGFHAAKEMIRRPLELRRDVSVIAQESHPQDLIYLLQDVPHIGVFIGNHDGICRANEISEVADEILISDPDRPVDIVRVDIGHFHPFQNRNARKEMIDQIHRLAS